MKRLFLLILIAGVAVLLAAPVLAQDGGDGGMNLNCGALDTDALGLSNAQIAGAELIAGDINYPSYCRVTGVVDERTGIDGKTYGVNFEMRLPTAWNGRFLYQQNGGNDGSVVPAQGGGADGGVTALARGFAVLSTDAGHSGSDPANLPLGLAAGNVFGLDPLARSYYGYMATEVMIPVADLIIETYYGEEPTYRYMMGCSNGGRHSMVAASRFGQYFDGIIAGDPGFNLPQAAVQHAWDVQSFQIANPDMRQAFSREDMQLVADSVVAMCDMLDGAEDGMVNNLTACQSTFDISALTCPAGDDSGCLSADQVTALAQSMSGPVNSAGEALYSDWSYDGGLNSEDWRFWKLESPIPPWDFYPLIATLGGGSLSYIFTTPPTETPGDPASLVAYLTGFDFDEDAPLIYNTTDVFTESAMDFMTPPDSDDPTLTDFYESGGRMIVYHGQSDGVFSVNDTINWYEMLDANYDGNAEEFVRLFTVPGMNHCGAGPATDQFDALTALMNWVEAGVAPDQLIASVDPFNPELPESWSPERTRPLCPWPLIATYQEGEGDEPADIESADSFICEAPM
jgi:feruloyl esterase